MISFDLPLAYKSTDLSSDGSQSLGFRLSWIPGSISAISQHLVMIKIKFFLKVFLLLFEPILKGTMRLITRSV